MATPLEVFCCYAREDQEMLEHLKKHLALLQRQGQITIWSDSNLNAGVEWEKELHQHLESANIILLLISPYFMASDYCYSTEMGRAIARHNEGSAVVIPILLRSTFWQNAPFAKLQMVPTNAKPVTSWPDRDDALHDITIQVNRLVSELQTRRAQINVDGYDGEPQRRVVWQPEPARDLFRIPAFDPAKLTLLHTLTGHMEVIYGMAISPDSKTLASYNHRYTINHSNYRYTIKLWELPSGQELRTLIGHMDFISGMAISPDSKTLASCSADCTIKLWEMPSGRELRILIGHKKVVKRRVRGIAISPDGTILASCGDDGTIKLWG